MQLLTRCSSFPHPSLVEKAVRILQVTSIEDLEEGIAETQSIPVQIGKEAPKGLVRMAQFGPNLLTHGKLCANISTSGPLSLDKLAFGMVLSSAKMKVEADKVLAGDIAVFQPGAVHVARHNGQTEFAVITVDRGCLHEIAELEGIELNESVLHSTNMYRPGQKAGKALSALMRERIRSLLDITPDIGINGSESADDILRVFLQGFVNMEMMKIETATLDQMGYRLMKQVRELLEDEPNNRTIHVDALAGKLDVSRRQLFRAFQAHLGVSPARYLKLYRFSRVRMDLSLADRRSNFVAPVVQNWGFRDLGRFAVEYREMFGESPSQTLRN